MLLLQQTKKYIEYFKYFNKNYSFTKVIKIKNSNNNRQKEKTQLVSLIKIIST